MSRELTHQERRVFGEDAYVDEEGNVVERGIGNLRDRKPTGPAIPPIQAIEQTEEVSVPEVNVKSNAVVENEADAAASKVLDDLSKASDGEFAVPVEPPHLSDGLEFIDTEDEHDHELDPLDAYDAEFVNEDEV